LASHRARRRSRRRRLIRSVGILAAILLVVAVTLRFAGPVLVQPALVAVLERQGLTPVRLQVATVGLMGVGLTDLAIGGATAARADLLVSPLGLLSGRADRITLTGLRLAATLDDDGLAIRGFAAGGGGALPVDTVALDGAEIALATPVGAATARLDATLTPTGDGLTGTLTRATIVVPALNLTATGIYA
jgi:hypothetical protein